MNKNHDISTGRARAYSQNLNATIKWQAPPLSCFKLNFDGSVTNCSAACGFVIRDGDGRPIVAEASNAGKTTVPVAEATALRNGLVAAKQKGLRRLQVEGDSKLVIDAVNGVSAPPWRLKKIIEDIRMLAQDLEAIHFKHIFREANFVADAIADLGHNCSAVTWHDGVPKEASRALLFDIVNTGCPRGFSL